MKITFPRLSLFLKIFIWFWTACLAIGLVFLLSSLLVQSDIVPERMRGSTVRIHAIAAADIFEKSGKTALTEFLAKTEQETAIAGQLLDREGRDVTGADGPSDLNSVPIPTGPGSLRTTFSIGRVISSYRFISSKGIEYVFICETRRFSPYSFLYVEPRVRLIRFPLIILTAGVICYLLARYLTSPIIRLQKAAGQLADGNLKVRVGTAFTSRNDEIADLSRDFDTMAERLEASAHAQKRLLADISHELRSPLARLSIAASLARDGDTDEVREAIHVIEREAGRMNDLIGRLLSLGRLENDDNSLQRFRPIDLADMIKTIVADSDFEAQNVGKRVVITSVAERCSLNGDPELLRSAIENVVRNAIIHTRDGSTVEVGLAITPLGQNKMANISVRDHGNGVPPGMLDQIFQPFYRVEHGRERETGGVGLGLSIAERAVRLHRGNILAENAEGGGLRVTIVLPLDHDPRKNKP